MTDASVNPVIADLSLHRDLVSSGDMRLLCGYPQQRHVGSLALVRLTSKPEVELIGTVVRHDAAGTFPTTIIKIGVYYLVRITGPNVSADASDQFEYEPIEVTESVAMMANEVALWLIVHRRLPQVNIKFFGRTCTMTDPADPARKVKAKAVRSDLDGVCMTVIQTDDPDDPDNDGHRYYLHTEVSCSWI